jgi:hypothetical protein
MFMSSLNMDLFGGLLSCMVNHEEKIDATFGTFSGLCEHSRMVHGFVVGILMRCYATTNIKAFEREQISRSVTSNNAWLIAALWTWVFVALNILGLIVRIPTAMSKPD